MWLKLKQLVIISIILFPVSSLAGYNPSEIACGTKICVSDDGDGFPCKTFRDKYYSHTVKKHGVVMRGATKVARKKFSDLCKNKGGPEAIDRRTASELSRGPL